ncbi:hypothetical protein NL108_003772 [Boleophthalmus pectinirostris]|uniref:uncharacterized protein LOC110166252 n=1 Tax=Boleophthalmus pectinirostris TaxID=150288 RepID=UPI000A1C4B1C|nr:uncharacterized protein LOC110166252 [Boleophthalmus pectinirostris]KAJ0050532.1 hypothetical protein NL108_003772 [Boleophthalmus pectinirostris]
MAPNDTMDAESLQKEGPRRGRCLDCCLVISVIVLFTGMATLAVLGVLVVQDLEHKLMPSSLPEFMMEKVTGDAPDNIIKMKNFAYLEATLSELKNHTMPLEYVSFLSRTSVGSNFEFHPVHHSLTVKQDGIYFMYVELNVTCLYRCRPGLFTVQVSDKLSCEVKLPNSSDSHNVQKKCWTVKPVSKDTHLLTDMFLPHGPLHHWKLELRGSGVGLFLVEKTRPTQTV